MLKAFFATAKVVLSLLPHVKKYVVQGNSISSRSRLQLQLSTVWTVGRFLTVLVTNYLQKLAKWYNYFLGLSEKHHFLVKTAVATFWATFGNIWAKFYFNIWSHWLCMVFVLLPTCLPTLKCLFSKILNLFDIIIQLIKIFENCVANNRLEFSLDKWSAQLPNYSVNFHQTC